jgi:nucleotide-binding universal stress UspA family protein
LLERLLVPLDGSSFAEHALSPALGMASRWSAAINLVTVANPAPPEGKSSPATRGDDSRERGESQAEAYLNSVEERIRAEGFDGEIKRTVMPAGNVANSLVRYGQEVGADLVIMTTHGRGPLRRAWLGSTADAVIRNSSAPVLLIRPPEEVEEDRTVDVAPAWSQGVGRVLVPLDGSARSESVLRIVRPLLSENGSLTLFQTVPPLTPGGYPYMPHTVREERDQEEIKNAALSYLEGKAAEMEGGGQTVSGSVVTSNQPAVAILRRAEADAAQLIAMSTAGRGGAARLLLGSVADKVVRGSSVPVLIYRDPREV